MVMNVPYIGMTSNRRRPERKSYNYEQYTLVTHSAASYTEDNTVLNTMEDVVRD